MTSTAPALIAVQAPRITTGRNLPITELARIVASHNGYHFADNDEIVDASGAQIANSIVEYAHTLEQAGAFAGSSVQWGNLPHNPNPRIEPAGYVPDLTAVQALRYTTGRNLPNTELARIVASHHNWCFTAYDEITDSNGVEIASGIVELAELLNRVDAFVVSGVQWGNLPHNPSTLTDMLRSMR